MSCKTCREPNDPHWPAYHSCIAALEKRMADRIAKLEDVARRFEHMVEWQTAKVASEVEWERRVAKLEARAAPPDWTEQPDGMPIEPADKQTRANAMLEAARDYLAQDKSLDELMPSPWQVEPPAEQPAAGMKCGACGEGRHADCSGWCFCRECQPAEQPVSAADGKRQLCPRCDGIGTACNCINPCGEAECESKQPAPVQGAPAEPLSAMMAPHGHDCPACGAPVGRCCWPMDGARKDGYHQERWNLCQPPGLARPGPSNAPLSERMRATGLIIASAWADEVDALGARLAAAERARDEAKESAKAAWQQRDYAVAISDAMRDERDALRQGRPGPK